MYGVKKKRKKKKKKNVLINFEFSLCKDTKNKRKSRKATEKNKLKNVFILIDFGPFNFNTPHPPKRYPPMEKQFSNVDHAVIELFIITKLFCRTCM